MEIIKKHLRALGITEEEIAVYLNALESGATTVLEFAQNTGIPRTTVYLLVDSLLSKGLINEEVEGKKKRYLPVNPIELISLALKKQEQYKQTAKALEEDIYQLQAIYNLKQGKPKVSYYEGKKDIKLILQDSLNAEKVYMHFMSSNGADIIGKITEEYIDELIKQMIPTEQIISNSSKNLQYQKEHSTERNKVVCIDATYSTNVDYLLFKDSVVYITYKDTEPIAICITDKDIAFFEKIRFQIVWKMASKEV